MLTEAELKSHTRSHTKPTKLPFISVAVSRTRADSGDNADPSIHVDRDAESSEHTRVHAVRDPPRRLSA
jgi:hypothetical protein